MKLTKTNKKLILSTTLLILLIMVAWFLMARYFFGAKDEVVQIPEPFVNVVEQHIADERYKLPDGFPTGVFVRGPDFDVISKDSIFSPRGELEATIEIASKLSIQENFDILRQRLEGGGWTVTNSGSDPNEGSSIKATKSQQTLDIKIYNADSVGETRVLFKCVTKNEKTN